MYLITGSQRWQVMRNLAESLAGRVAILELPAFCSRVRRLAAGTGWLNRWLEAAPSASTPVSTRCARAPPGSMTETIWRGGFPGVQELPDEVIPGWMQGYVTTYLQRDVRTMLEVRDEVQFATFLALCASLTAQECNPTQLDGTSGCRRPPPSGGSACCGEPTSGSRSPRSPRTRSSASA